MNYEIGGLDREAEAKDFDHVETLLVHLLFGAKVTADTRPAGRGVKIATDGSELRQRDGMEKFDISPMFPALVYTGQLSGDRIFAATPDLLLRQPQEILGHQSEIVLFGSDTATWKGIRRLHKTPRGVWVPPGACLYEVHTRVTHSNGREVYHQAHAALTKRGSVETPHRRLTPARCS